MRFEGKVAIVTGAASGIGRATAARLAAEGAKVCIVDREQAALDAATPEGEVMTHACDVSDEAQVEACVKAVVEKWGRIDAVANNAGVSRGY
ncbi:SDR family oxidoreductase, partial [Pseudooceanicola nanhaiensis]